MEGETKESILVTVLGNSIRNLLSRTVDYCTRKIFNYYYVRHKAEMHENRRFFSTGMEFAKNAHAYVLKTPSRS